MSDYQTIHAVNNLAREISQNVQPIRTDVKQGLGYLKAIIDYFSKIQKTFEDGFSRMMENQAMILFLSKSTELSSYRQLLDAQAKVLEKKIHNLEEDLDKLRKRYEKLDHDLSENTETTILKLDGHVINLNKHYFNEKSAAAYNNYAVPVTNASEKYCYNCNVYRNAAVDKRGTETCRSISNFINKRESFSNKIKQFILDKKKTKPVLRAVPVYVLEMKNGDIIPFLPGKIKVTDQGVSYNCEPALQILSETLNQKIRDYYKKTNVCRLSRNDREQMKKTLAALFNKGYLSDTKWVSLEEELNTFIDTLDIEIGE